MTRHEGGGIKLIHKVILIAASNLIHVIIFRTSVALRMKCAILP